MTKSTPVKGETPAIDPNNLVPVHIRAIEVCNETISTLQALVGFEHAAFAQCHGEAYKLLAKLARAKSKLAYAATKKVGG